MAGEDFLSMSVHWKMMDFVLVSDANFDEKNHEEVYECGASEHLLFCIASLIFVVLRKDFP